MADTAFQTLFLNEYIAGFERGMSPLRSMVSNKANIRGEKAVFLVSTSSREAVTRGPNGLIPASTGVQTQYECVLEEYHDLVQKTGFDVTRGQADQRAIMQSESQKVIARKIDQQIIDQLATSTLDTGTATIASKTVVNVALATLLGNNVPFDGDIYGLITPAFWAYISDEKNFSSSDYVAAKPMVDGPKLQVGKWLGITWLIHSGLPGVGTNAAKCFVFHKSAIGHAAAAESMKAAAGYHDEQDYSWCRTSIYMGAKLLQNSGVVTINHDDSALIAS